jgi:hypothetical protein
MEGTTEGIDVGFTVRVLGATDGSKEEGEVVGKEEMLLAQTPP